MDGSAFRHMGRDLLILAFAGASVIGGGAYLAGRYIHGNDGKTVGVHMTQEQQVLRKNGALCDAYLAQAFAESLKEGKVVDLKLPANPAQNCPKF